MGVRMAAPSTPRPSARGVSALPGCYIFFLGAALVLGALVWAGYTFVRQAGELQAFTDPHPAPLAVATPAPAEVDALQERISAFADAAKDGRPAELVLSADDLNAMIAGFPRLSDVKPSLRVHHLGPDATFTAEIRFPLNSLPGQRRYLNGELDGRFGLHPEAGLFVSVLDVRVPGRIVPPGFLEVYQRGIIPGKNFGFLDDMLVRNFREDPAFADPLRRIASLRSTSEAIIFSTAKPETNPTTPNASSATMEPATPADTPTAAEQKSLTD